LSLLQLRQPAKLVELRLHDTQAPPVVEGLIDVLFPEHLSHISGWEHDRQFTTLQLRHFPESNNWNPVLHFVQDDEFVHVWQFVIVVQVAVLLPEPESVLLPEFVCKIRIFCLSSPFCMHLKLPVPMDCKTKFY